MAFSIAAALNPWHSLGSVGHSELHTGVNDLQHKHHTNHQRDCTNPGVWWRLQECQCKQSDSQRRHRRHNHHVLSNRHHQAVQPGSGYPFCWRRRANRHHENHHDYFNYKQLVRVLAIVLCFCLPVKAEGGGTTAIANPVATSSGSVSNQAVQINQGGYSQQGFGNGHSCNSSTLVFTPFYLANDVNNHAADASYIRNQNFGAQVSFSVPLDFQMVSLCKELARRKIEKERGG